MLMVSYHLYSFAVFSFIHITLCFVTINVYIYIYIYIYILTMLIHFYCCIIFHHLTKALLTDYYVGSFFFF